MIRFEKTQIVGWEPAIRGMRNPLESWEKSDSRFNGRRYLHYSDNEPECFYDEEGAPYVNDYPVIGPNDLGLMNILRNAGSDDRKFMRQIVIYVDITAPLYWWKEFDTYKIGTVANSCSTMHRIHAKEFTMDDFSHEHLIDENDETLTWGETVPLVNLESTIHALNRYRDKYIEAKTKPMKEESKIAGLMKKYWWQMIQLLPSSYMQTRTVMLNYEVAMNAYHARKGHKLDEWREKFCEWVKSLPYSELITAPLPIELLREENKALKEEIERLKAENKQLRDEMAIIIHALATCASSDGKGD